MSWPPTNQNKDESHQLKNLSPTEKHRQEMGFSLIIEEMIKSKKPLIGQNPMYDWIYLYNQFIAPLPQTYSEFISEWN